MISSQKEVDKRGIVKTFTLLIAAFLLAGLWDWKGSWVWLTSGCSRKTIVICFTLKLRISQKPFRQREEPDSESNRSVSHLDPPWKKAKAFSDIPCKVGIKSTVSFFGSSYREAGSWGGGKPHLTVCPCRTGIAPGFPSCLSLQATGVQGYAKASSRNLRFGSHSFTWMFTCFLILVRLFFMHGTLSWLGEWANLGQRLTTMHVPDIYVGFFNKCLHGWTSEANIGEAAVSHPSWLKKKKKRNSWDRCTRFTMGVGVGWASKGESGAVCIFVLNIQILCLGNPNSSGFICIIFLFCIVFPDFASQKKKKQWTHPPTGNLILLNLIWLSEISAGIKHVLLSLSLQSGRLCRLVAFVMKVEFLG